MSPSLERSDMWLCIRNIISVSWGIGVQKKPPAVRSVHTLVCKCTTHDAIAIMHQRKSSCKMRLSVSIDTRCNAFGSSRIVPKCRPSARVVRIQLRKATSNSHDDPSVSVGSVSKRDILGAAMSITVLESPLGSTKR